ncbi:zinc finger protein SNAI3 [Lepus europaeus]|uniref:zinc finger protein SNAI3 n=1 Tax=Lepus europaeus TaxID=9983 RepID=UPI002B46C70A|nr:zinc finger protein SNAI3 [Lepus europaeus]
MPRSFLVRTHSGHRVPNYGQLEMQREASRACSACGGLVEPLPTPAEDAPRTPADSPAPWPCTAALACLALPRGLHHHGAPEASGPDSLETGRVDPRPSRAPGVPLKDSLNHLNLPPVLALPTRWPPILGPGGDGAPGRRLGADGAARAPGALECVHCRRPYHTLAGLARHQQLHCPLQAGRTFTCKFCGKQYGSLGALKMHLRTHTLPCACAVCGKAFSRPWLLQGHLRTHTGEKPYACSHCSRAFADRSNLRAHLQTHSDTKRYRCRSCAKAFSRMSLLTRHEEAGCRTEPRSVRGVLGPGSRVFALAAAPSAASVVSKAPAPGPRPPPRALPSQAPWFAQSLTGPRALPPGWGPGLRLYCHRGEPQGPRGLQQGRLAWAPGVQGLGTRRGA